MPPPTPATRPRRDYMRTSSTLNRTRTFFSDPCADPAILLAAILARHRLTRPLTPAERIALAVAGTEPTHLLTIDSALRDRSAFDRAWRQLAKRVARRRPYKPPLAYFGTVAQGEGSGGFHLHMLLWDFLYAPMLIGQTRAVGLGHPDIKQIGATVLRGRPPETLSAVERHQLSIDQLQTAAYIVNQHEPAFGRPHHQRHQPRAVGRRRYLYPQRKTLALAQPKLLAALDAARSPTVSDEELIRQLPRFSVNQ